MPSSADRKRLEVPTYLHEQLVEIAIEEDRTVSSVVQEVITLGLRQYAPRSQTSRLSGRLTERAARALEYAREETLPFNHHYVGTEHLLLGLLRETEGVAARILTRLGVDLERSREYIAYHFGRGSGPAPAELSFAPRARKVLRLAEDVAEQFDSSFVGTEHLLLALTRVEDGAAAKMLASFGVAPQVRNEVVAFILDSAGDRARSEQHPSEMANTIE